MAKKESNSAADKKNTAPQKQTENAAGQPKKRKCLFRRKPRPVIYEVNLIPKPYAYQPLNGYFVINKNTLLIVDPKRKELAESFQDLFFKAFGHNLFIHYNKPGYNNILFEENPALDIEGYMIECYPDRMKITAGGTQGFYYAMQSLRQILKMDTLLYEEYITFPCMVVSDFPKYRYRSFMLDVSRHFFDKTEVKRYIELMSLLKYNVFHWHLSDDQGFRFEIDKYPFINMTSSQRLRDVVGRPGAHLSYVDGTYKGHYTKEDIREVIAYAKERFITVVPEIDMPGHVQALIAAYPWLSCSNERVPVMEEYGVSEEVLCVGKETTYGFLQDILDELFEVFDGPYFHIGGDEVLTKHWETCTYCKEFMDNNHITDYRQLQTVFINRIAAYCRSKGKTVIGWNDGIKSNADKNIISQFWMENKDKNAELVNQVASLDRKIIISSEKAFYGDYPYARTPLRDTYFYKIPAELAGAEKNILGYELPLWTEYVLSRDKADMNLFPRALAAAEQCWTRQYNPEENVRCKCKRKKLIKARYGRFLTRVKQYEPILDTFHVNYADLKIADPTNKKYRKTEARKWSSTDQYSELKMNKNLKEQAQQFKKNQIALEKINREQALQQTLGNVSASPIRDITVEVPYDKDVLS
ncbi:MAG: beta-N-acetylhexosaminidase [Clostridiales bacterium]|jgi:hexosaminidase|nr:beta-N-acetylhexosaminidase [Clostridiales bacterium]